MAAATAHVILYCKDIAYNGEVALKRALQHLGFTTTGFLLFEEDTWMSMGQVQPLGDSGIVCQVQGV
jgi:hypothetical protein